MKIFISFSTLFCLFTASVSLAQNAAPIKDFKGMVTDKKTNEPLQGASVVLVERNPIRKSYTFSGLNGGCIIRNIPAGDYNLTVTYIGYLTDSLEIHIGAGSDTSYRK